ncbi:MAG: hypothetical protein ABIL09_05285 [Gemmatimonadota bacterium]
MVIVVVERSDPLDAHFARLERRRWSWRRWRGLDVMEVGPGIEALELPEMRRPTTTANYDDLVELLCVDEERVGG